MSLSELAKTSGVAPKALRVYEESNLVRPLLCEGERRYGERDVIRLQVVVKARRLGFSLEETRRIILARDPCEATACRSIAQIEARLALLRERRRSLDVAIRALHDALEHSASPRDS